MKTTSKEKKVLNLDFFKKAGRKGGLSTKKKYGLTHYSKIRKKVDNALDKGVEYVYTNNMLKRYTPVGLKHKECIQCKQPFKTNVANKTYCGPECRDRAYNEIYRKNNPNNLSTTTIGAVAELIICAKLLEEGYSVFRAVSASCFCDLVITKNHEVSTVEVRTARRSKIDDKIWFPRKPKQGVDKYILYFPDSREIQIIPYNEVL